MDSSSDAKYFPWPSTVNFTNFVTVKPCVEGGDFKIWKEQMICLLESQDVLGFVDGGIIQPPDSDHDRVKAWRRTDRLVKGWILGSIGKDALDAVWEKPTARDAWLELENIFKNGGISESDEKYSRYRLLYRAIQKGNWEYARAAAQGQELSKAVITSNLETALHLAVLIGSSNSFVTKLVESMSDDMVAAKDCYGNTALHNAAVVGNTQAAVVLVERNARLLYTPNKKKQLPVVRAAMNCHKETLKYLISKCNTEAGHIFDGQLGIGLLNAIIKSEFLDIALDLAERYPNLTLLRDKDDGASALSSTIDVLGSLHPRKKHFSRTKELVYYEHKISAAYILERVRKKRFQALEVVKYLCDQIAFSQNEVSIILSTSILKAAEFGISEVVEKIIHICPIVARDSKDEEGRNIFLLAAKYRSVNVIKLLHNMGGQKEVFVFNCSDNQGNNIMHICGYLAPSHRLNLVTGAALQMQWEMQWFKEMEKYVHPSRRTAKNKDGQTPQMIFTKEHQQLKAEGERWMKDTANACTIAAALIATVMFTAAFTVPGGIASDTGAPILVEQPAFKLFAISDAVSLFTSITSLLMFLSILASRYAEEDFLYVLPMRVSVGLFSLFISITFMLVAFSATMYLVFRGRVPWILIPVAIFACLPVASFVLLQFPLLVDVVYSTYGPGIFQQKY